MSEPAKNTNLPSPESYSPKKPRLAEMMKGLNEKMINQENLPKTKIIENIMSPDEPWTGSCGYLLCFTSMFMHLERHTVDYYNDIATITDENGYFNPEADIARSNREHIYRAFLTATGMGLVTTWKPEGRIHDTEAAKDFIPRSMKLAGYEYEIIRAADKSALMDKIKLMIYADVPVLARYDYGWELIIGYDSEADTVIFRKGGGTDTEEDYDEDLEYLVCVTATGHKKPDIKTVISDIIETMETNGADFGPKAYYDAIDYYSDDEYFESADELTLKQEKQKVLDFFISHAEMRGFSWIGQVWRLQNRYGIKNPYDISKYLEPGSPYDIGGYCDQHHQISWGGDAVLENNPENLRKSSVRNKMIYVIYQMMENDMIVCRMYKDMIGLDTPDALVPVDRKTGKALHTLDLKAVEMTLDEIMKKVKVKSVAEIDFIKDIEPQGDVDYEVVDGILTVKSENKNIKTNTKKEYATLAIKKEFAYPLKIDMQVMTDVSNVHLYYKLGKATFEEWRHIPGNLRIGDIDLGSDFGYNYKGLVWREQYMDISWIIHRDFTAVICLSRDSFPENEVRHYGINYPYMAIKDISPGKIRFGTGKGSTITVTKLTISELE